jgi:hypothetical protein
MEWDLGVEGLAYLAAMSLGFGVIAQAVMWRSATHWLWLIGAATFFIAGLLISEGWFGSATEEELQPNIDGLSRDEALLAIVPGIISVYVTWAVGHRRRAQRTDRLRHQPSHP